MANPCGTLRFGTYQARRAQQSKVFRDGRAAGPKIRGELANGMASATQQVQDLAARGIGNRPKNRSLSLVLIGNHSVTYYGNQTVTLCQRRKL